MAAAQTLTARQGDTLDLLIWRDAGLGPAALTAVYEANPGLADLPAILPLGTQVLVPAMADAATAQTLSIVQLWD